MGMSSERGTCCTPSCTHPTRSLWLSGSPTPTRCCIQRTASAPCTRLWQLRQLSTYAPSTWVKKLRYILAGSAMNAMLAALTVAGRTVDVLVQRYAGALRLVHVEAGGAAGGLIVVLHRHRQVVLWQQPCVSNSIER